MDTGSSWGRCPPATHRVLDVFDRHAPLPPCEPDSLLAYGNGRSYGDVCLNDGRYLINTRRLDRFIDFDAKTGVFHCEAGVLLADITRVVLPQGWFLPVTPGTQFVTVGGAIANDVHGKNHHRAGTFGSHVLALELLRSTGEVLRCSPQENAGLFCATIGGLGLTGLIRKASIRLRPVTGRGIVGRSTRFSSLEDFFRLSAEADAAFEYTVAWLDCFSPEGRGIFTCGNHGDCAPSRPRRTYNIPFALPLSPVNALTVRAFNALYSRSAATSAQEEQSWDYQGFFYPLDRIGHWNRLYGRAGFFQYQCVLPLASAHTDIRAMLRRIRESGQGSFLAVLKVFGDRPSPGLMSFPRPGVTLALDFPNRGAKTLTLLESLDSITQASDGAVYPAKDARMSAAAFKLYFPKWAIMQSYKDPAFSSSFWRRVST